MSSENKSIAKDRHEEFDKGHEQGKHHHEAPHPGHSDAETLRKQKAEVAQADQREHGYKIPPKRGDSSDRSFGT